MYNLIHKGEVIDSDESLMELVARSLELNIPASEMAVRQGWDVDEELE
jgi:hypothetical protein